MAAAPPSTRSAASRREEAAAAPSDRPGRPDMASITSRVWKAMASTQARASWARPTPRVRPVTMPRAWGSHHGLPSPVSAGTKTTPPVSGTEAASGPTSAAAAMMPSPSRSHWTAAPVTKMDPSSA